MHKMIAPKIYSFYNEVAGVQIKWTAVAGAGKDPVKYNVYRRGAGSTYWTYLGTTKNLYFIDNEVKNNSALINRSQSHFNKYLIDEKQKQEAHTGVR